MDGRATSQAPTDQAKGPDWLFRSPDKGGTNTPPGAARAQSSPPAHVQHTKGTQVGRVASLYMLADHRPYRAALLKTCARSAALDASMNSFSHRVHSLHQAPSILLFSRLGFGASLA